MCSKLFSECDASHYGEPCFEGYHHMLRDNGPTFNIPAESITILNSPDEWFEYLLTGISQTQHRVIWSSLYIGEGDREKQLLDSLERRMEECPSLDCTVLLDSNRAVRSHGATKFQNNDHAQFPRLSQSAIEFTTPMIPYSIRSAVQRYLLPERVKEICGVSHMKVFVFDDSVLMTGANLNQTYLSNRIDRYVWFQDCPGLADCLADLVKEQQQSSKQSIAQSLDLRLSSLFHRIRDESDKRRASVVKGHESDESDTFVTVTMQYPSANKQASSSPSFMNNNNNNNNRFQYSSHSVSDSLSSDSKLTSQIISSLSYCPSSLRCRFTVSSAYLNLHCHYRQLLRRVCGTQCGLLHSHIFCDAITSHESCNSFYNAPGLAKYIVPLYSLFADDLCRENPSLKVWKYARKDWTFHGKGFWAEFNCVNDLDQKDNVNNTHINPKSFMISMIGSSNLNNRSVNLDSELDLTILTRNQLLMDRLCYERDSLFQYCVNPDENISSSDDTSNANSSYYFGFDFSKMFLRLIQPIAETFM